MRAVAIPAVVMAGVAFYVGLYHLLIFWGRRQERAHLSFALTCLAVALYDISSAGIYNAASVAACVPWQKLQIIAVGLVTPAILRFTQDYIGRGSARVMIAVTAVFVMSIVVQLVDHSWLTITAELPAIKEIALPFGQITYYEAVQGPLTVAQSAVGLLVGMYILGLGVSAYRSGQKHTAMPLILAMGIFFAGAVNDVAVGTGVYKFVYVIEYAYMSVVLLMTHSLSVAIEQALSTARQREQELAQATRQAQQVAQSAQEAREREEQVARQLRQAVQEYTAFLERVASGDYGARLALDPTTQGSGELAVLGHHLNATVESLVKALQDLQAIQRRYAREAWEGFTKGHSIRIGFRCQDEVVEPSRVAWLPPMTGAVRDREVVADEQGLALPIVSRGEIIGAIGARREGAQWSDDEVALVTAITDQLAQTLEGLRLLDETQRQAAREQIINTVTAHIRSVPTVNAILQRTVEELGRNFGASRASIRVEVSEPAGKA